VTESATPSDGITLDGGAATKIPAFGTPDWPWMNHASTWATTTLLAFSQTSIPPWICGPDVTGWLVTNLIDAMLNNELPGRTAERMLRFRELVKPGGIYDFKKYVPFKSPDSPCPTPPCRDTVTLCDKCLSKEVVGNIFYGMYGNVNSILGHNLRRAADAAQAGGRDESWDTAAINVGVATMRDTVWNHRFRLTANTPDKQHAGIMVELCSQVEAAGDRLVDPEVSDQHAYCTPCTDRYDGDYKDMFQKRLDYWASREGK